MPNEPALLPEAFHIRYNLISPDWISTYIYGPLYIADMPVSTIGYAGEEPKAKVYPSLVQDYLNVEITSSPTKALKVSIFTAGGIHMKEFDAFGFNIGLNKIDVTDFPSGIYFITIVDGNNQLVRRFIKL